MLKSFIKVISQDKQMLELFFHFLFLASSLHVMMKLVVYRSQEGRVLWHEIAYKVWLSSQGPDFSHLQIVQRFSITISFDQILLICNKIQHLDLKSSVKLVLLVHMKRYLSSLLLSKSYYAEKQQPREHLKAGIAQELPSHVLAW